MNIIYFVSYICGNLFLTYIIWKYFRLVFDGQLVSVHCELLCIASYFSLITIVNFMDINMTADLLINFLSVAALSLLYRASLSKRTGFVLLLFLYLIGIHIGLVFLSGHFRFLMFNPSSLNSIIGIFIERILNVCLLLLAVFFKSKQHPIRSMITYFISIFITPVTLLYLLFIALTYTGDDFAFLFYFTIPSLILINIFAIFAHDKSTRFQKAQIDLTLMSYQSRYYENQFGIIRSSDERLKSFRHDMQNHMLTIYNLIDSGEYDNAKKYIDVAKDYLKAPGEISKTGNVAVDSLINYKLCPIAKHIALSYHAEIPQHMNIDAFDLTVILGNLLDNAIESLNNSADTTENKLSVLLKYDKSRLVIKISNAYSGYLKFDNSGLITAKSDGSHHGIGLNNVRSTIDKYGGSLKINHDKNFFTVSVIIYDTTPIDIKV